MSVQLPEWLRLLELEYFADFLPSGGATFKIAVCEPGSNGRTVSSVVKAAESAGFVCATVDAFQTRVHMIDHIYARVAQQIDWENCADRWLRENLPQSLLTVPTDAALSDLDAIALASDLHKKSVVQRINQTLTSRITNNGSLWSEFRYGIGAFCVGRVVPELQRDEIVQWLKDERVSLTSLKKLRIRQRITRVNARAILGSTAMWLRDCGYGGLVLVLDLSSVFDDGAQQALTRTRAQLLDLYEVMRQFIDETDVSRHLAVVVVAGLGLTDGGKRSYDIYDAFKLRIEADVFDRVRDNPLNSLVRISTTEMVGGDR